MKDKYVEDTTKDTTKDQIDRYLCAVVTVGHAGCCRKGAHPNCKERDQIAFGAGRNGWHSITDGIVLRKNSIERME
jgi:hypothetical protein